MMTKTKTDDKTKQIEKTLMENKLSIDFIESVYGEIDFAKLIQLGIEALTLEARMEQNRQRSAKDINAISRKRDSKISRDVAIKSLLNESEFYSLDELFAEVKARYDIDLSEEIIRGGRKQIYGQSYSEKMLNKNGWTYDRIGNTIKRLNKNG